MSSLQARKEHQRILVSSRDDIRSLTRAFAAFTSLQHAQLNPVLDTAMVHLSNFLESRERQGEGLGHLVQLDWAPACSHGLQSLSQALANSQSKCNKVSIPAMHQRSALLLSSSPIPRLSTFAHNLTSLILQFATADAEGISLLSAQFRRCLTHTMNLEAIHIGFPMAQPLNVRLEEVFHGIRWPKLRALGIQAWRLGPEEIIDIARRHRRSLRGLRLREVVLKEGRWSEVLQMLRTEMEVLDWVSLRRIDYARHFDNLQAEQGFEIGDDDDDPDHQAFGMMNIDASSSDDENEGSGNEADDDEYPVGVEDLGSEEDSASNEESDHNPLADQLDLPVSSDATAARSLEQSSTSTEELGDDGIAVGGRQTTKVWEAWVTARHAN
jgi:hypothetical protein